MVSQIPLAEEDLQHLERVVREKAASELEWIPVSSLGKRGPLKTFLGGKKMSDLLRTIEGVECMKKQKQCYFRVK